MMKKDFLRPIGNTSVVQQVIDRLTSAMIHKSLRPGDQIPTEMELAASFGVGRNSVREAIKILVSFGVLEIRRPEGTFVTKGFSNRMIDPLLYGIILDDTDSMDSLKELREWVDVGVMQLAVKKATDEDIRQLERCFQELEGPLDRGDVQAVFDADNAFHEAIASAAHNELFAKLAELARILISEIRMRTIRNMAEMGKLGEMKAVHAQMLRVVQDRNPDVTPNQAAHMIVEGYFYHHDVLKEE